MKKRLLIMLGVWVGIFLIVIGINVYTNLTKGSVSERVKATEEELVEAAKKMSEDIEDGEIFIDGEYYELPIMVDELLENNWKFDNGIDKNQLFDAESISFATNMSQYQDSLNKTICVELINYEAVNLPLKELAVYSLDLSASTHKNKVILPQGITWGSTIKEVEKAYGEADHDNVFGTEGSETTVLKYITEYFIYELTFTGTGDDATLCNIEIEMNLY